MSVKLHFLSLLGTTSTGLCRSGLSTVPQSQSFINYVFCDMLNRRVIVYMDDILVYSVTLETHISHVRAVLQCLISHQLYAKAEKCEFQQTSTTFLGYFFSPEGEAMDDRKVQAVLNWPCPTTVKEMQRFLGFANFHRRFIRDFSSVASPLTSMIRRKGSHLSWSSAVEKAFNHLKEWFTTAPILHHPDPEKEFIVEIDASSTQSFHNIMAVLPSFFPVLTSHAS